MTKNSGDMNGLKAGISLWFGREALKKAGLTEAEIVKIHGPEKKQEEDKDGSQSPA